MKDVKVRTKKDKRVALTVNFTLYVVVLIGALIFTQALRSRASNIFFGFVFFMPWAMLIYAMTSRVTLKIFMLCDTAEVDKGSPYSYKIRLVNESVIPYPFIDAKMWLPQSNSVRCALRTVKMTMSPRADYTVNNTVSFRFRGTYEIGVDCIYVYDFFRMFRVKVDIGEKQTVYVLPRRLNIEVSEACAVSDSASKTQKSSTSYEKIEISDIREYRNGDALKSIHWKLSSKSEDFMVRDYDTGSSRETFVLCDMSACFPTEAPLRPPVLSPEALIKKRAGKVGKGKKGGAAETTEDKNEKARRADSVDVSELALPSYYDDMNEYCADGVVELTVSALLKELRSGSDCTLLWFDRRAESGVFCFTLRSMADLEAIFRLFSTAPLCPESDSLSRLSTMISDTQDTKQLYVTSNITPEAVRDLCAMPAVADASGTGAAELILYNPTERFAHPEQRKLYIEGCREQLASKGLRLTEGVLD